MKIKKLFELNHFKQNSFKKGDALYPKYILSSFMGKFTVYACLSEFPVKATGFQLNTKCTSFIKFLQSYLLSV